MNDIPDKADRELEHATQAVFARDLLARDRRHVWHPFTQHGTEAEQLLIAGASGASLYDADGREILDLISSWWTCTHGHCHPKLNEALAAQAARFEHVMFAGFTHQPAVDLATALAQLLPGDLGRGRAQDRLSILGQSRRRTATRLPLLRRRLSRRYGWCNVTRPRLWL